MRLRSGCSLVALLCVLAASTGCETIKNRGTAETYKPVQRSRTYKDEGRTPQAAAQNEVALAEEYLQAGQSEIALDRLKRAVKIDPSSAAAYTMLGLLYERINRPGLAGENYAKAVKLAPDKGAMANNYGTWLCRSGHPAEADPYFRKALADPFYATPAAAMDNAATCALQAGNATLAESYYRQLLATDANNAAALLSLATMQFQRGEYLRARGFMERLLASTKAKPDMLDLAAHIEDKLGDSDAARAYRARLAAEFPSFSPTPNSP